MRQRTRARRAILGKLPLVSMLLVVAPRVALAAGAKGGAQREASSDVDADWRRIGIGLLLQEMDCAYRNGDLAAAAALIDFPLVVVAGAPDGRTVDVALGPEEWLAAAEPLFNEAHNERARRKASTVEVITDSLAWIVDDRTATARPSSTDGARRPVIAVRRRGKWLIKAVVAESWPGWATPAALLRALG